MLKLLLPRAQISPLFRTIRPSLRGNHMYTLKAALPLKWVTHAQIIPAPPSSSLRKVLVEVVLTAPAPHSVPGLVQAQRHCIVTPISRRGGCALGECKPEFPVCSKCQGRASCAEGVGASRSRRAPGQPETAAVSPVLCPAAKPA